MFNNLSLTFNFYVHIGRKRQISNKLLYHQMNYEKYLFNFVLFNFDEEKKNTFTLYLFIATQYLFIQCGKKKEKQLQRKS